MALPQSDALFSGDSGGGAVLSVDRCYRYHLWRQWADVGGAVLFVMLNPSTADADTDDPTIRRCVGFAKRWGGRRLDVVNLFAYRAASPRGLLAAEEPVGPANDRWIRERAALADVVVAAWGAHGGHRERGREVRWLLRGSRVYCLGSTRGGHPRHPLYVRGDTPLAFDGFASRPSRWWGDA